LDDLSEETREDFEDSDTHLADAFDEFGKPKVINIKFSES